MVQPLQERLESNWETLKDKVKESLDKVVEAVGTYPVAPDDLGLVPVADVGPVLRVKKRKAARKSSVARRPAAKGAAAGMPRSSKAGTAKRARKSA